VKLQISRRETPTRPVERRQQWDQSYFKLLPFVPADINCLAFPEIIAEKIRACYQRDKPRDVYDLGLFATKPLDQSLIRRLVVLKLWQARDAFDPDHLMKKLNDSKAFDWDDLNQLVRRTVVLDGNRIAAECVRGYRFLLDMTEDERQLATDLYQRQRVLGEKLRAEVTE
jgi:predicted nucleotidyltransferase component of viral defense system